ncbi:hypothetical protein BD626DRAFT_563403 [Schizophyllum amplum]|uniref:BTB domain-containing protein n=1 Tax=Schizophyllum amplum TaxID=97359 RepID=A0A550CXZ5_9AGAR|nr:hypothetical protein BD626DRAFT_563403 [Auriculariopsis ampla]
MSSSVVTAPSSHTRSESFYFDDGDIVVQVEDTLLCFHAFHLQRATAHFDDVMRARDADVLEGDTLPGFSDDHPLRLEDIKREDFENLLWFFYDSAYKWSGTVDGRLTPKWESVLLLAEKYGMNQVAKVTCYALDRAGALDDVRKIALCARHDMGKDWVLEALRRVLLRGEPLSIEESRLLGLETAATLAAAREKLHCNRVDQGPCAVGLRCTKNQCGYTAVCKEGLHLCYAFGGSNHITLCPRLRNLGPVADVPDEHLQSIEFSRTQATTSALSGQVAVHPQGEMFFKVENSVVRIHSYHLKRASSVFVDMLQIPNGGISAEGRSADHPISLDVKKQDFDSLLWFFYDSPYQWSYITDPSLSVKWEAVLAIADMFNMEDVCRVATYALDHHGGLTDIRKISLCVRHSVGTTWALQALQNVCVRQDAITPDEARDMGLEMTTLLAAAREQAMRQQFKCSSGAIKIAPEVAQKIVTDTILHTQGG